MNQRKSLLIMKLTNFRLPLLLVCFLTSHLCQLASLAAEEAIPGTRVFLEKPLGFERASNFSGFQDPKNASSIMISEIPGPFDKVSAGFNEDQMKPRQMTLLSKEPHKVGDFDGLLVELQQQAGAAEFHKWLLVFGDQSFTILVTAAFPEALKAEMAERMKKAILTARFVKASLPPQKQNDLNFALTETKGLKLAGRIQNALLFNQSGSLPKEKLNYVPVSFVAAQALNDLKIDNREAFARKRLHQTTSISKIEIIEEKDIEIGGLPGREILARAESNDSHEKLFLYQVILYGAGSYFIMQGECNEDQRKVQEAEFKTISKTFRMKKQG